MEFSGGKGPPGKLGVVVTFREALNAQWFEVVERWADARGEREAIVFAGPLQACGEALENDDNADSLIIRPISF